MEYISFDDFKKVDIRIGKILTAERVEGSDKLIKLSVDFGVEKVQIKTMPDDVKALSGEEDEELKETTVPIIRQIIAGIAKFYAPEDLIGKECPFAYNLAPRMLAGLESQGMIMCPSDENGVALLHPNKELTPGSIIK